MENKIQNILNEHNKIKQEVDNLLIEVASSSDMTKEKYNLYCSKIDNYRSIRFNSLNKIDKLIIMDTDKQFRKNLSSAQNIIKPSIEAISNELNVIADILLIWELSIFK